MIRIQSFTNLVPSDYQFINTDYFQISKIRLAPKYIRIEHTNPQFFLISTNQVLSCEGNYFSIKTPFHKVSLQVRKVFLHIDSTCTSENPADRTITQAYICYDKTPSWTTGGCTLSVSECWRLCLTTNVSKQAPANHTGTQHQSSTRFTSLVKSPHS